MVTRTVVLTLLGLSTVLPARADGILEQMQNEVAAITVKTRAAVVAVEDERKKITFQFSTPPAAPNPDPTKRLQSMQEQIIRFDRLIAEHDLKLSDARKSYEVKHSKEALTQLDLVTSSRKGLEQRRAFLKREAEALKQLYRRQEIATIENSVLTEQIGELSKELAAMQKDLIGMETKYGEAHPRLQAQRKGISLLKVQLDQLKGQMAQVQSVPAQQRRAINILRANSGTGFSIGEGYVLTTADVVEPMENPTVVTDKGTRIKAKIVGVNSELNIGLLKLQAETNLPALTLGDSQPVQPGHFAISIGNQTGDPNSVALNLVGGRREQGTSAGNRFYPTLIQIAGTVGAGNSGAPLMNAKGEVIGIVVAIPVSDNIISVAASGFPAYAPFAPLSPDNFMAREPRPGKQNQKQTAEQYERAAQDFVRTQVFSRWNTHNSFNAPSPTVTSAGYALPINEIKMVIEQLKTGQVTRGWIGIAPEDEEETVEEHGILNTTRQVKITGVFPESPAKEAGIQPGDVLLRINDKPIRNSADVRETSLRLRPGDTLILRIRRHDKQPTDKDVELKILPRPMEVKPAITLPGKKNNNL